MYILHCVTEINRTVANTPPHSTHVNTCEIMLSCAHLASERECSRTSQPLLRQKERRFKRNQNGANVFIWAHM